MIIKIFGGDFPVNWQGKRIDAYVHDIHVECIKCSCKVFIVISYRNYKCYKCSYSRTKSLPGDTSCTYILSNRVSFLFPSFKE